MKLLITGASGFIGAHIITLLEKSGHQLVLLSRNPKLLKLKYRNRHECYMWDALLGLPPKEAFNGVNGIINLMGEGVANKRWSKKQKQLIYDTRVIGTKYLVDAVVTYQLKLDVFISTSAIGYYDHRSAKSITESGPASSTFLGHVCQDWEAATMALKSIKNCRLVIIRVGLVIGNGGLLKKIKWPFLLGLGGKIGSGHQWMNWIDIHDISRLFVEALTNPNFNGTYNGVSPNNVTNTEFTKSLGKLLKRPTIFSVPAFLVRLLLGDFSNDILFGINIDQQFLEDTGFKFQCSNFFDSLKSHI